MRSLLVAVGLAVATGWSVSAAEKTQLDIYLNGSDTEAQITGPVKALTSAIYNQIGVRLVWHTGELPSQKVDSRLAFSIRVADHAPDSATPEALASAHIVQSRGAGIVIYQDRLRRLIAGHQMIASLAAAYVLAHELAHVMQGVGRHSEAGIMKAHWNEADYREMVFHKLVFTATDVELIHRGLAAQSSSAAVSF